MSILPNFTDFADDDWELCFEETVIPRKPIEAPESTRLRATVICDFCGCVAPAVGNQLMSDGRPGSVIQMACVDCSKMLVNEGFVALEV